MDQIYHVAKKGRFAGLIAGTCGLLLGAATLTFAAETGSDPNASCRVPFEQLKDPKTNEFFLLSSAVNENTKLADNHRQRYIVADLNSADENGNCRGVQEYFTPVAELSDFPRLQAIAAARKIDV